MKKGFTLVELLAVLALISVIAIITVPIVISTIENNKKQSILINTEKTIKALETYKTDYELETGKELKNVKYTIENKIIKALDLSINGSLPENGEVTIDNDGNISIYAYENGYCSVRGFLEGNVRIDKIAQDNCNYNSNIP